MFSGTQSGAAKVEAQHGKSKRMQRLHGMKHDLVVHRPAKQWVRMADQSGMRRIGLARIEQCLEPAGRAVEKQRADGDMRSGQMVSCCRIAEDHHNPRYL